MNFREFLLLQDETDTIKGFFIKTIKRYDQMTNCQFESIFGFPQFPMDWKQGWEFYEDFLRTKLFAQDIDIEVGKYFWNKFVTEQNIPQERA